MKHNKKVSPCFVEMDVFKKCVIWTHTDLEFVIQNKYEH